MIFNEDKTDGLWIDSCYLREKGSNKNLLKNGGFEDVNKSDEYFEIKEESVTRLANYFDDMAEYNLSGVFSTAPHYIPNTFYQEHPEIASGNAEYVKFIPDHPTSIEYFEKYYRTLMPRLTGKPAFDSIILMNEPTYYTYKTPYYLPIFQQKMEEKYGTIEALNEKWGTDYADFASVEMPTEIEATPRFYDWRVFNDSVLPDFNRRASALVKEYDKNVLTQTKVMQTTGVSTGGRVAGSNNWEEKPAKNLKLLQKIEAYVDEHFCENSIDLISIADSMQMSVQYLTAYFKKHKNTTLLKYITQKRMDYAKELLLNTNFTITDIALKVGYTDASVFTKVFKKTENTTPGKYRALLKENK